MDKINKLELDMRQVTTLMIHTPDKLAKMLYADKLMSLAPEYMKVVYNSQRKDVEPLQPQEIPPYFFEGGSRE